MVRFANPVLVGAPCAPFPSTAASRPTMSLLAIDLGGTKLASALFSSSGDLLQRDVAPLAGRRGREVGAMIAARASEHRDRVTSIGVAVPGIYRADRGSVWAPNIPGW